MFDFLGFGKTQKKPAQKKKNDKDQKKVDENKLMGVTYYHDTIKGQGTKKLDLQDAISVAEPPADHNFYFFAVLDGHGSSGKEASSAASDNFQQYILEKHLNQIPKLITNKDRESFLNNAFKNTEKKLKKSGIDYSNSGTCCVSIFIQGNNCAIANLGDSRAVLCRWHKEKIAIELSTDHKPTNKEERMRILKKGGKIERMVYGGQPAGPYRVWADAEGPGIAMTRTLGDLHAKKIGLISEPEIKHLELKPGDKFIVLASDGLWDVMSSAQVVGFILKVCGSGIDGQPPKPHEEAAFHLVREARTRWETKVNSNKNSNEVGDLYNAKKGIDDITAIVVFLRFSGEDELPNLTKSHVQLMNEADL